MWKLPIPLLLLLALALALVAWVGCGQQRRRAGLEKAAAGLGLRYVGESQALEDPALRGLPSLSARPQNFFTHAMESGDLFVFDWTWRDGVPKQRKRAAQTVVAIQLREASLPVFVWTGRSESGEKGLVRRLERRFGAELTFPDDPGFSDRAILVGPDRDALRLLFEADRRARLERPDGVRVEAGGEWLLAFRPGQRLAPDEIGGLVESSRALAAALQR